MAKSQSRSCSVRKRCDGVRMRPFWPAVEALPPPEFGGFRRRRRTWWRRAETATSSLRSVCAGRPESIPAEVNSPPAAAEVAATVKSAAEATHWTNRKILPAAQKTEDRNPHRSARHFRRNNASNFNLNNETMIQGQSDLN